VSFLSSQELLPFEDLDVTDAETPGPDSMKASTDEEKELTEVRWMLCLYLVACVSDVTLIQLFDKSCY
jgi:hypothetical protein